MRITNSMLVSNFLTDMGNNMNKMNTNYTQLVSGKKMVRISDDPVRLVSAMNARKMINTYEQYEENLNAARNWNDQAETALTDINDTLKTIYEQVVFASSEVNQDVEKAAVAKAIEEYRDHIQQNMNASINFKYLFAGYNATKVPFERDANGNMTYNGIDLNTANLNDQAVQDELAQHFQLEVGVAMKMDVTFTGIDVVGVGEDNMFKMLDDLVADLYANKGNDVLGEYLTKIEDRRTSIMEKVVTIGSRTNKLDMLENRYSQDIINYDAIRGNIEDIDDAEAIMNFKFQEAVYNRALAAGAKIIMPSLMDYVR